MEGWSTIGRIRQGQDGGDREENLEGRFWKEFDVQSLVDAVGSRVSNNVLFGNQQELRLSRG